MYNILGAGSENRFDVVPLALVVEMLNKVKDWKLANVFFLYSISEILLDVLTLKIIVMSHQ